MANVSLHFYFFISDRWSHYLEQPLQNISVENSKQLKFLFQFSFVVFFIFLSSRWKTKATLNLKGEITLKLFLMTASRGPINNNKRFLRGHFKGLFSHLILLECYQDCNLTEQSLHYFTVPLNKRCDQTNSSLSLWDKCHTILNKQSTVENLNFFLDKIQRLSNI